MPLNLNELKELIELISAKDIAEFELEGEGVRLRVKKGVVAAAPGQASNNHPPMTLPPATLPWNSPSPAVPTEEPAPGAQTREEPGWVLVRSPMVGTFYRAPEPGAPPFVNMGDRVKPGQVLCIIEAMKLMNEIESEHAGEIVEIFIENGKSVQYGDQLFAIRASH